MRHGAGLIATVAFTTILGATLAPAQIRPIPKPVSPPSPNRPAPPSSPPAGGSDRPALPRVGDVPLPSGGAEAVLAPFIDNETIGVIRLDLKPIDLKAVRDWVIEGVSDLRKNEKEVRRAREDVSQEMNRAFEEVERFRSAGIGRVYVVASWSDLSADRGPFIVVPVEDGADPKAIESALQKTFHPGGGPPAGGGGAPAARTIGNAVVFGDAATLDRLKGAAPAERTGLSRAFEAAGAAAQIRVALVPQDGARKALEALSPDLPNELGGGPVQSVSRGLASLSIGLALPPNASLKIVFQGTDAAAAGKLNDIATKAIAWAADRKDGPREALAFTGLLGHLKPQVEGDQVVMTLSAGDTRQLAATVAGALLSARNQATRVSVASNLRQLCMGVVMFANEHHEELPKDLGGQISSYMGGPESFKKLWVDPLRPNQEKPYVYLKLADKLSDVKEPSQAVLIYENHTTWDDGINVAFADGHVEWVADEKQFKQLLADTKKNNPQAAEMPQ